MAARMYLYGVGTQVNEQVGIQLLRQAAEMGHVEALKKLSEFHRFGEFGLELSEEKARSLQEAAFFLEEKYVLRTAMLKLTGYFERSKEVARNSETSPLSSKRVSTSKGIFPKPRKDQSSPSKDTKA